MEDEKVEKKGEPLLYIVQPELTKPDLTMQDVHLSHEDDEEEEIENETTAMEEEKEKLVQVELEEQLQDEEGYEETVNDKAQPRWTGGLRKVKAFREMSLDEKLQYLSGFSITQPPYYCEFITKEQRYQGSVLKYEKEIVSIKTLSGEEVVVPVIDIQVIRIIR
ncbi:CotO family spore coat protein [Bacillus sp. FJAT-50079]|uniref:CotO family spore coat protein n=1 Tax=Bacillus sp. FJAT-50079 TaxID=2833577 RepID=UPI001BC9F96B|nr:CotO family spore coat protein [Bacillus sp. FJAT-50079]MBS4207945.1 hypothetical protein [Bacillus sp. FJAT-50079]